MKLTLKRKIYTRRSTIGDLELNGRRECYVLEDPVRPKKIKAHTAIPVGTYRVVVTWSPRFKVMMPLLVDVPNYEGVRIHAGNRPEHTEGCLLPGRTKSVDFVGNSRVAYRALLAKIQKAIKRGEEVVLDIVETGKSPYAKSDEPEDSEKADLAKVGGTFRITADPLRIRSSARTDISSNIRGRLPLGTIVRGTGRSAKSGWIHVTAKVDGRELTGYIAARYAESVGSASETRLPKEKELYRVAVNALNFRRKAGDMDDRAILATLPRGHVVRKTRDWRTSMWWEVETVIQGVARKGFVYSSMLRPVAEENEDPAEATAPVVETGGVVISEKALDLILSFEGMDQPGKWPGVSSGITLGHGYDLGYHTHDQLMGDWGPHLSDAVLNRLAKALGKRGSAAKAMAPRFSDIRITVKAADGVFSKSTLPRIRSNTQVAFPGLTSLPVDAQGALGSLVYNRGTSMNPTKDKRKEMREVRDLIADANLSMPDKLSRIAERLRAMKRHWPNTRGLRRRRDAEADLIESCI